MSIITLSLLAAAMPDSTTQNRERYADPLGDACVRFGITSPKQIAMFIAQVGHESGYLRSVQESLNYRAEALVPTFGSHRITAEQAARLGRSGDRPADQQGIANVVYGGRFGQDILGNTEPGDGWRFRGRGLIQTTGRKNYATCGAGIGLDLISNPDLLLEPEHAAASAGWFWSSRGLNRFADAGDLEGCTKKVNGGLKGLDDRRAIYDRARKVFGLP
jgi:putative chitinase